jgi:predicted metalloprotease with PDZ domain
MLYMKSMRIQITSILKICILFGSIIQTSCINGYEKEAKPSLLYSVSMPDPSNHLFHVILNCKGLNDDTIDFKMPRWMPGYYQIMDYPDQVRNFSVNNIKTGNVPVIKPDNYTWRVVSGKSSSFSISYDVWSDRNFVACNFLDSTHGYIIPGSTFMYPSGHLEVPVTLKIFPFRRWKNIATGLEKAEGKTDEYYASDFDFLYDCPILVGNLEELTPFEVYGIVHQFIAFNPGNFDHDQFILGLAKTVKAATDLMGDIPYNKYTFIGIGPGYGGIEHLNNATVSFNGSGLEKPGAMNNMLRYLGHEYFHNYNVKRIRPYELGPFDYEKENRTNLLWVSEGLTVYYEYLIVKRAGLMSEDELLNSLADNINTIENDAGRKYQSLSQASYETWSDGPFGNKPGDTDKSISYYEKGPIVGMILDFSIRNATQNEKSLDDVMRFLYRHYYKELQRGFTDAEFQEACELVSGTSLSREFEYVYTTKEIEYSDYLSYAGLKVSVSGAKKTGERKFMLTRQENMNPLQLSILQSWSGN